jgi:hypothetical protein
LASPAASPAATGAKNGGGRQNGENPYLENSMVGVEISR